MGRVIKNNRHKLKIYIINYFRPPEDFFKGLETKPFGDEIKKIIIRYYFVTLKKLLGDSVSEPHPFWNQLQYEFFENQRYKNK